MKITKLNSIHPNITEYRVAIENYGTELLNRGKIEIEVATEVKKTVVKELVDENIKIIRASVTKILPNLIKDVGQEIVLKGLAKIIKAEKE